MVETSYVAVAVVGTVHAVRRERPARFGGIELPGTPAQQALSVGTPLVGIAGEVDTWCALRKPTAELLATVCVVLDATLPAAFVWGSR